MAVSFGIESWIEGGVIAAVIALNIVVGFWQEFNAEKTMDSLKSLSSPTASAIRNSENITIPTVEIVPGDMVELKTGDTVPADLRYVFNSFAGPHPAILHRRARAKLTSADWLKPSTSKLMRPSSLASRSLFAKSLNFNSTTTLAPEIAST